MIYSVVLASSVQYSASVFRILFPYRSLQNIECSSLCCTVGPVGYLTFCLSIHPLMDIWVVSTFWLS